MGRLDAKTVIPADRLALLRGVPMFELVAPRVLERLALFSATEHRPDGDAVTVEGEVGDLFYVIVSGEVVVTHGPEEIRRLGPGDWFGELALLRTDAHRTATVTAAGPVDLLVPGPGDVPHRPAGRSAVADGGGRVRPGPLPLSP